MATKKCTNGHLYDPAIYGDKCPFCPSSTNATKVNTEIHDIPGTRLLNEEEPKQANNTATIGLISNPNNDVVGGTIIRRAPGSTTIGDTGVGGNRKLVGLLVSYSSNPCGEVYKVYEGRTTIGRDRTCDIPFPNDQHMSSKHLLIQYVEAKGTFKAKDMGSSNGSNVNGNIYVMDETFDLETNDKIVLGGTVLTFLTIPN